MKEIKRLKIMMMLEENLMTRAEAAQKLDISERQVYRIQKSYREKGEKGIVHGNRGKVSHRRISEAVRARIETLLIETYKDYNTRHFQEKLEGKHGIGIGYTSLQSIRRAAGYPTPREKSFPKYRERRVRKPIYGMMLQADGSKHAWLEEHGPKLTLVAMIDDATNRVWGTFRDYEDAGGYVEGTSTYLFDRRYPYGALHRPAECLQ